MKKNSRKGVAVMNRPMNLLLDSGPVGSLCHTGRHVYAPVRRWLNSQIGRAGVTIYLPEIVDYEVRRKLLHLIAVGRLNQQSLDKLDDLPDLIEYLPLDTATMSHAAALWAQARRTGLPTAPDAALDVDVILAAQAHAVVGTVVTTNAKHLSRFIDARTWEQIP